MRKQLFILVLNLFSVVISAQVSGTVFRDFNANGTKDNTATFNEVGLEGVTVTAYDATGTAVGTTTSLADGTYTIAGISGAVRVEFTNLPSANYTSPAGGTSVQFVTAPATGVNFGVILPSQYVDETPLVTTSTFYPYAHDGVHNWRKALLTVTPDGGAVGYAPGGPCPAGHDSPAIDTAVLYSQIGTCFGLGYQSKRKTLFAGTYVKQYSDIGPQGTGAIYRIDMSDEANPTVMNGTPNTATGPIDLNLLFGAGTCGANPFVNAPSTGGYPDYNQANDRMHVADAVYNVAFSDVDVSHDENRLFALSFADQKIYNIPIDGSPITAATVQSATIPVPAGKTLSEMRPMGMGVHANGKVYVITESNFWMDTTKTGINMDYYGTRYKYYGYPDYAGSIQYNVMEYDPTTNTFNATPTVSFRNVSSDGTYLVGYGGLTSTFRDLTFDDQDAMVLAGRLLEQDINGGVTGSRLLRFYKDPNTGQYALENTATVYSYHTNSYVSSPGIATLPANYHQNFYYQLKPADGGTFDGNGGLAQVMGRNSVVETAYDPCGVYTGGIRTVSHDDGTSVRYETILSSYIYMYATDGVYWDNKRGVLGDLEIISDPAPIEIGNRVWLDTDKDGIQDADERGIDGVVVELLLNGNVVQTQTTASGGQYYFSNVLSDTNYVIRITNASGSTPQDSLLNLSLTNYDQGFNDAIDSDAKLVGTNAQITLRTGSAGQNNHTYDFGFNTAQPVIEITKTVNTLYAAVGDDVTFTIIAKNSGNTIATGIQVLDTLSSNLSFVSYASVKPSGATYDNSTGIWNIGDILPGDSAVITITATIIGEGVIYNIASYNNQSFGGTCVTTPVDFCSDSYTWTLPGALTDYNNIQWFKNGVPLSAFDGQLSLTILPADVTDIDTFTVSMTGPAPNNCPLSPCCPLILQKVCPVFDLALKKVVTASGPFAIGADVTFAITVYNQGNFPAYNVEITDYIPTGMSLNDAAWTASGANATYALAGPIAAGDSTTVNITLTVDSAPTAGSSYINWAEISAADDDTDSTNTPPTDVDSTPDGNNFNQSGETNDLLDDNIVDQNGLTGGDEDDHDPAEIIITIPCPNPPCTPLVITKRN